MLRRLLAMNIALALCATSSGEIPLTGALGDANPSLIYSPADGSLLLDAAGKRITTLEIISSDGIFTGVQPAIVEPPFDVFRPDKLFLLKTDGLTDTDFGPVMAPGLSFRFIASDLSVAGSILPSGPLEMDMVPLPEPGSIYLALAAVPLLGLMRNRTVDAA